MEFHLHSVVLTLYGKQQGARKAYNPGRRAGPLTIPFSVLKAMARSSGMVLYSTSVRMPMRMIGFCLLLASAEATCRHTCEALQIVIYSVDVLKEVKRF